MLDDPYAWHDPFAEIAEARLRARSAERDLNIVTKGFGPRLIDVWDGMAGAVVRDVAKPYAAEHGAQACNAIAQHVKVSDYRDLAHPEMLTFVAHTIQPIQVACPVQENWR